MYNVSRAFVLTTALTLASATPVVAQVAQAPKLNIVTPQADQIIFGDKVPVLFAVEGFTLTDYKTNTVASPGQGHVHLWLDDQNPTPDSATKVAEDNFTFSDVPPGDHILKAELVGNNHASLTPPVVMTVNFKTAPVGSPAPAPAPTFDKNTAAVIFVVVALVIIAAWWYTKDDEDEAVKEETKSAPKKRTTKKKSSRKARRK